MKHAFRIAGLFAVLAGQVLVAGQSAQTPAQPPSAPLPTFKAEVEYVEVDALVTDADGNLVRNLTKEDFQVFEDGKAQTISAFTTVDLPIERAVRPLFAERPIEPDVQSNERPFDGRVYVMILDDLHVAALRSQRVKMAARQFIEQQFAANDLMAVVFTGGRAQDAQDFTNNKRLLLAAVDKFMGQKLDSITISRNREYFRQLDAPVPDARVADPEEMQRGQNARSMLRSLQQVSEWFGGVRGRRKSLLLLSEGVDYDITDTIRAVNTPANDATGIIDEIRQTIAATARANVSIYAIDPRGLTDQGDETITVGQFADAVDPRAGIGMNSLRNELLTSQNSLRDLAEDTGGFAVVNRNVLTDSFAKIVRENSSYYVLAYMPPGDKRAGRFHRIEVKMKRPGLTVRSRRGYVTPRGKPAPRAKATAMPVELFDAISSPLQVSGVTIRTFATPFKGPEPNGSVLVGVEMRGRDLTLDNNAKLEMTVMAIDTKGKTFGGRTDTVTLNLRPETKARVEESGIRTLNRLELPPGRYQVRVAVRDGAKNNVGSVIQDLEVPNFYRDPISMSGVALTSLGTAAMMTAKQDEQIQGVLPAPPVSQRTFASNDELALFAEVYDRTSNNPHRVEIVTSVLTDEGRVLFKSEETRDSSELQGAKGGYGITARIPLSDIPPGRYVLSVAARSLSGNNPGVTRQIQFDVRAPNVRQAP